jgi:hypothetical protein
VTSREAFKAAFYLRCADAGLSPEEADGLVKGAGVAEMLGNATALALTGGLLIPPALGAGAGWLAAKARDVPYDADDLRKQELIDEFRRLAAQARRKAELKQHPTPARQYAGHY